MNAEMAYPLKQIFLANAKKTNKKNNNITLVIWDKRHILFNPKSVPAVENNLL